MSSWRAASSDQRRALGLISVSQLLALSLWFSATAVADSAQFSAMVTETAQDEIRGTALTLQTAVGFLLTLVTIRGVPLVADAVTWRRAFPALALGPILGVMAMRRLSKTALLASY